MSFKLYKLAIFFYLLFTVTSAQSKPVFYWRVVDWPPFYILNGPNKGQGIYDQLIENLSKSFPEYRHETVAMNTLRSLKEMKKNYKMCHPSALANTDALLSNVNSYLLPYRIIYNQNHRAELKQKQQMALTELLAEPKNRFGYSPNRYSETINDIFAQHQGRKDLVSHNDYTTLIKLLLKDRVDFLVEYQPVITYYQHILSDTSDSYSLAITELSDTKALPVYVACPDNEWGHKVIRRINTALAKEAQQADYLDFRLRWYGKESREKLEQHYHSHYLQDKH